MAEYGHDDEQDLSKEEAAAIRSLQRLAAKWPRTLTLISMDGSLAVIRTGDRRFLDLDGPHQRGEAIIEDIRGIPNTGGGW